MDNELEKKVNEILNKRDWPSPVFSLYLSIPAKDSPTTSQLLSLFHSFLHNLTEGERKTFKKELQLIEDSIHSLTDTRGKKTFIFFVGKNLFENVNLNVNLNSYGRVKETPYLLPIKLIKREIPKTLIILADRQKLRLMTVVYNELENELGLWETKVPPIIKAKKVQYGKYDKIERHIENHFDKHLEILKDFIENYFFDKNIETIIIGGNKEIIENVEKIVSKKLLPLLTDKYISRVDVTNDEIMEKFLKLKERKILHYFLLT